MSGRRARAVVARRARRVRAEQRFDRAYSYRDARADEREDDRDLVRVLRGAARAMRAGVVTNGG